MDFSDRLAVDLLTVGMLIAGSLGVLVALWAVWHLVRWIILGSIAQDVLDQIDPKRFR